MSAHVLVETARKAWPNLTAEAGRGLVRLRLGTQVVEITADEAHAVADELHRIARDSEVTP